MDSTNTTDTPDTPDTTDTDEAPTSGRPLVLALAALVVLTVVSWAVSHVQLGAASTWLALAIAALKAGIVGVAFMEIRTAPTSAWIAAYVTISFIALLAAGTIGDLATR